jgi:predicted Rdx family selenoprotein
MTDYIFSAGYGLNKVYKYYADTLGKVAESENYGGTVVAIVTDDDFVYAAGWITQKIYKYRKSDLVKVAESADYGGVIEVLAIDDQYIYAGGQTTKKVYKYNKSDLVKVAESGDYGGTIRALLVDDDYVFAGGYDTTQKLYKYDKSDMSKLAESADYGGIIRAIADDDTYIYCGGDNGSTQKVFKLAKNDLSKAAESSAYATLCRAIIEDTSYIYAAGWDDEKIYKLNKSDLTKAAESAAFGGVIEALAEDDTYLYAGGQTNQKIYKYLKSDMSFVGESLGYTGAIYTITLSSAADTEILSVAEPTIAKITKEVNGAWTGKIQISPDDYLNAENYVEVDNEQYIAKKVTKAKSDKYLINAELLHNGVAELTDLSIERFYLTEPVEDLLDYILDGTGWVAGTVDINETVLVETDRRTSVLEALNQLAEKCNGELYFHSLTRIVDLKRQVGSQTGLQLRCDKNCKYMEREEDSYGLATRVYIYGQDNYTINTTIIDDCEDESLYIASGAGTTESSSYNRYGKIGIQLNAAALNETFIRDLGAGGVVDLSGHTSLKVWIFSETANAAGFTFGIGEAAYDEITGTTGALAANCWHEIEIDLSFIDDGDKDAIRYIGFKNLTDGVASIVFDGIRAYSGNIYIDSDNLPLYKVRKEVPIFHSAKPEAVEHELILYPTDDAEVRQQFPNTNYGSLTYLDSRDHSTTYDYLSYMKWDVSQIPAGATITAATLYLTVYFLGVDGSGVGVTSNVHFAAADWEEDTLTYNNKPAIGDLIGTIDMTAAGEVTLDLTDEVEDWWDGSAENYGIRLFPNATVDNARSAWYSKESPVGRPYIKILYTTATDPASVLEAAARAYLDEHDEPKLKYKVKATDLSKVMVDTWEDETISLGDTVRIYDAQLEINVSVRVKKITKDLCNPDDFEIELVNKTYGLPDVEAKLTKQLAYAMPFMDNEKIINAGAVRAGYLGSDVS